jgi:hypothetical protein
LKPVAPWRIVAAGLILAGMVFLLARLAPVYFRNVQFQNYVAQLTQATSNQAKPDDAVRTLILYKAHQLELPVLAGDVQIKRQPDGNLQRVDVRYFVRVGFPGYTVDLHFHPGAGTR